MLQKVWLRRTIGIVTLAVVTSPMGRADEPWGYLFELESGRIHLLRGDSVKVGRLTEADVVLSDPRVSRRHAEIRRASDRVVLVDVGSTNGTRRNGELVRPGREVTLVSGDILIFAFERLLYHENLAELWDDALQHSYLASFVRLRVPVASDRTVESLGRARLVTAVSYADVDEATMTVEMSYPEDLVHELAFRPNEAAFVGDVGVTGGELRLSLWGLSREGSLVSRRASFSRLKHGELRVRLAADSLRDSRAKFETNWLNQGIHFLFPMLGAVAESLPEEETISAALKLTSSLVDQDSVVALRDAVRTSVILHRHAPDDSEPPLLAARAGARWVKQKWGVLRGSVPEEERAEFKSMLSSAKKWLEKATELDADKRRLRDVAVELAEAEELVSRLQ